MNQPLNITLPLELEPFRSKIEATFKPYIKILAKKEANLSLWQSKFRGLPYLPKNEQYPKGSNGQPLHLLAQINCEEVPELEPFPTKGILQFYIAPDDLYGLEFEDMTRQDNFRVQFFPEIIKDEEKLASNFDFLPPFDYAPVSEPCSLTFEQYLEPISVMDYQFEQKIFGNNTPEPQEKLFEIYDIYQELFKSDGHKLGGYPVFTQSDPRDYEKYWGRGFNLLLQIDTDSKANIMWGDVGVANFFIQEADLRIGDFSKILYSWDCH
jgi:uncharacterized protein YwqG